MKTAKEMAIDLDMKTEKNDDNELIYRNICNEDLYIIFYKKYKTVGGCPYYDFFCDIEMLKFINKQVEELGCNMLKIKDNIALKELEKFGFVKVKKGMTDFCSDVKYWYTLNESEYDCICIMKDRKIFFGIDCYGETHDVMYDLIKADLVEKVDD